MPQLPVTLTFIALVAAALMPMTAWIGLYRGKHNILRGDGGDPVLHKRIRAHGQWIETAPLVALALGAAESLGAGAVWLWLTVAAYGVGRALHWMIYDSKARGASMSLTTGPAFMLSLWVLWTLWL